MTARHCSNAGVETYESTFGLSLPEALREIADLAEDFEGQYIEITTSQSPETAETFVTAYVHA